jgi:thioredoxin reductase (NADPH)
MTAQPTASPAQPLRREAPQPRHVSDEAHKDPVHDALVIGGGPAGLSAAMYLARFCRDVVLIDAGNSRAVRIPRSHNVAGFQGGIAGEDLVATMRRQVQDLGVPLCSARVEHLAHDGGVFHAHADGQVWRARTVLLATGAADIEPPMATAEQALDRGVLRFCPVCDGYEARDHRLGVLCNSARGAREALYLRHFTPHVSVFVTSADVAFDREDRDRMSMHGVTVHPDPVTRLRLVGGQAEVVHGGRATLVDSLYSALGMQVHSSLAAELGAQLDDDGYVISDRHQQTCVRGLFVAGDVARGLNQISVAIGEAAIAASTMHLLLSERPSNVRA